MRTTAYPQPCSHDHVRAPRQLTPLRYLHLHLLLGGLGLFASCATPLSSAERAQVKTVSIKSELGTQLQYRRKGVFVFQQDREALPDDGLLKWIASEMSRLLAARGYRVVDPAEPRDYDILIEPGVAFDGGTETIRGAGFYERTAFGVSTGINVCATLIFKLLRPNSADVRTGDFHMRCQMTSIGKNVSWAELPAPDRKRLMLTLKDILEEFPAVGIKAVSLAPP